MRRRLARLAGLVLIGSAIALASAAPASAKVGPFSIEVDPEMPTAGETFEITVRCWHDLEHTDAGRCGSMGPWFEDFLWAVPAESDDPSADALPIELVRSGRVLRASLVVTTSGLWHLCVWEPSPCEAEGDPGYPSRIEVRVLDAPPRAASPGAAPLRHPPARPARVPATKGRPQPLQPRPSWPWSSPARSGCAGRAAAADGIRSGRRR